MLLGIICTTFLSTQFAVREYQCSHWQLELFFFKCLCLHQHGIVFYLSSMWRVTFNGIRVPLSAHKKLRALLTCRLCLTFSGPDMMMCWRNCCRIWKWRIVWHWGWLTLHPFRHYLRRLGLGYVAGVSACCMFVAATWRLLGTHSKRRHSTPCWWDSLC